jgi:hypothetical protein
LVGLFYAVENWRGNHSINRLKAQLYARGETLDWRRIIPVTISDDRNLAMTPLLKPLLDYGRGVNNQVEWRTSADQAKAFRMLSKGKPPGPSASEQDSFIDLKAWQNYFRGNMNFPQATEPQSPAADVLLALSQFDPQLKELQQAVASRPECRWPVQYEENFAALLPHLEVLRSMLLATELRAAARLDLGQTVEAFEDVKVGLRLAESLSTEPLLISHLVRVAMNTGALKPVREGLARHQWTDPQLSELQKIFSTMNLLAEYKRCMRGERAFCIEAIEAMRTGKVGPEFFADDPDGTPGWAKAPLLRVAPSGWFFQNECSVARVHDQYSLAIVDENVLRINVPPTLAPGSADPLEQVMGHRSTPYNSIAWMVVPAISNVLPKTGRAQTQAEAAAVACALERYRLSHQQYPEKLEQLVPAFLAQLPHDIVDGKPLRYRKEQEGGYLLYSIGWNQIDDGGVPGMTKTKRPIDQTTGDWVWRLPKANAQVQ